MKVRIIDPCGDPEDFITASGSVSVTGAQDETSVFETSVPSGQSVGPPQKHLYRAAHAINLNGKHWARRFGSGPYPIYLLEGLDPGNTYKTSCEACPDPAACRNPETLTSLSQAPRCAGMLELLQNSKLGGSDSVVGDEAGRA